ncbi:hypothetical protein DUNSADRAFT_5858 [Dunaliella salina]|uniref:Encoded protein n=1 Tax=Dunaliella salina TaxID=3046 RepID=A0ABQ7GPE6_DUNSA|nr:hypothetical protein DUNSADRAFT_5858 [Dunaliella salina]|eukprot:KAF5836472.1 hypothetical protein DUNSADRAFT_5858 [Dunaliella salina]
MSVSLRFCDCFHTGVLIGWAAPLPFQLRDCRSLVLPVLRSCQCHSGSVTAPTQVLSKVGPCLFQAGFVTAVTRVLPVLGPSQCYSDFATAPPQSVSLRLQAATGSRSRRQQESQRRGQ